MTLSALLVLSAACSGTARDQSETVGWQDSAATSTTGAAPEALVVGDSILHQALDEVRSALRVAGWQPTVLARPGSSIQAWPQDVCRAVARVGPSAAVVELGTNNCTRGSSCMIDDAIDEIMASLDGVGRVIWLNVQQAPDYPEGAEQVNAALQRAATRWPTLKIADFSAAFRDRPRLHIPDGVHLSKMGQKAFAGYVLEALESAA